MSDTQQTISQPAVARFKGTKTSLDSLATLETNHMDNMWENNVREKRDSESEFHETDVSSEDEQSEEEMEVAYSQSPAPPVIQEDDIIDFPEAQPDPTYGTKQFGEVIAEHNERSNKNAVHSIVVSNMFSRIKFLDKSKDLEFDMSQGSICHYVFNMCNLKFEESQKAIFWEKAKKWVVADITRLRSDKCTAIRNAFYGKHVFVVMTGLFLLAHCFLF